MPHFVSTPPASPLCVSALIHIQPASQPASRCYQAGEAMAPEMMIPDELARARQVLP